MCSDVVYFSMYQCFILCHGTYFSVLWRSHSMAWQCIVTINIVYCVHLHFPPTSTFFVVLCQECSNTYIYILRVSHKVLHVHIIFKLVWECNDHIYVSASNVYQCLFTLKWTHVLLVVLMFKQSYCEGKHYINF